jgi:excisionase family DNA binding protein
MMNQNAKPSTIRPATVKLLAKLMNPLSDAGLIYVPEMNEIVAQLRHLAVKGCPMPPIAPKLLSLEEAADMLGISYSNFKKLEREGHFPFKRKMVGTSIRFRNLDLLDFMLTDDDGGTVPAE